MFNGKQVMDTTVDAARRKMRDALDALRDEARKPLDDWEAAEATRIQNLKSRVERLANAAPAEESTVVHGDFRCDNPDASQQATADHRGGEGPRLHPHRRAQRGAAGLAPLVVVQVCACCCDFFDASIADLSLMLCKADWPWVVMT